MTYDCEPPQKTNQVCSHVEPPPKYCGGVKRLHQVNRVKSSDSCEHQSVSSRQHLHQPKPDFCTVDNLLHHQHSHHDHHHHPESDHDHHQHHHGKHHHKELDDFCVVDSTMPSSMPYKTKPGKPRKQQRQHATNIRRNIDKEELKRKLASCIKKFDERSPDTLASLNALKTFISNKLLNEECFPKREWPHCPPKEGPEPYEVPHPYIPGRTLYSKPLFKRASVKVTVDGRHAEMARPKRYYHEMPPLNVPPWVLPRYKSQELRGGLLIKGCYCWKRNGLQDDCPRWDCGGRPECQVKPLPACPPAIGQPIYGVRQPNLYEGKPPSSIKQSPPPPYPVDPYSSIAPNIIPNAPSIPCPLHNEE